MIYGFIRNNATSCYLNTQKRGSTKRRITTRIAQLGRGNKNLCFPSFLSDSAKSEAISGQSLIIDLSVKVDSGWAEDAGRERGCKEKPNTARQITAKLQGTVARYWT